MGLVALLMKGATLNKEIVDSNKCSYAHWACFTDRKFILTMLFRAGADFEGRDVIDMTPWDRAVGNWSIFCIAFMCDFNLRPLRTLYHLKRELIFPSYELIPANPKLASTDLPSIYIPKKLHHFDNIRSGAYENLPSLLSHNKFTYLLDFISYKWLNNNITSSLWLRTYFFIVIVLISHLTFLVRKANVRDSTGEPSGGGSPHAETYSLFYLITLFLSAAHTLWLCYKFGSGSQMADHFKAFQSRQQTELKYGLEERVFSDYYLSPQEYSDYLEMYSPGESLWDVLGGMISRGEWNDLNTVHDTELCGFCCIKKKPKTRHCPNVGHSDSR